MYLRRKERIVASLLRKKVSDTLKLFFSSNIRVLCTCIFVGDDPPMALTNPDVPDGFDPFIVSHKV